MVTLVAVAVWPSLGTMARNPRHGAASSARVAAGSTPTANVPAQSDEAKTATCGDWHGIARPLPPERGRLCGTPRRLVAKSRRSAGGFVAARALGGATGAEIEAAVRSANAFFAATDWLFFGGAAGPSSRDGDGNGAAASYEGAALRPAWPGGVGDGDPPPFVPSSDVEARFSARHLTSADRDGDGGGGDGRRAGSVLPFRALCTAAECERRVAALKPELRARLPCVALATTEAEACRGLGARACSRSTALGARCVDRGGFFHKYCVLASLGAPLPSLRT